MSKYDNTLYEQNSDHDDGLEFAAEANLVIEGESVGMIDLNIFSVDETSATLLGTLTTEHI